MENSHAFNQFRSKVEPALISKLEEFQLLGYDSVSEEGLWDFLTRKRWKKVKDEKRLYEIVDDILSVKVSDFISFTTIETYKNNDFNLKDGNEWKELLK
ncbi:post-transcriptional regulator [Neobacillus sp. FSL H8-0543]|uniref:post-transcriptional regulator n=1 Tax=Neobacillus sp. FSL H8-0543 TaxID=2954672 RepID=UPI003158C185